MFLYGVSGSSCPVARKNKRCSSSSLASPAAERGCERLVSERGAAVGFFETQTSYARLLRAQLIERPGELDAA